MERARLCARPACGRPAIATLTYDYATSTVWLRELTDHKEAHGSDLCQTHADRLRVPVGWALDDRRTPVPSYGSSPIAHLELRPPLAV